MTGTPYATSDDLLLGETPVSRTLSQDKFVTDAIDEIDSIIGMRYQTPVNVDDDSPVVRPARLLLKRLTAHLATGRLILAVALPQEQSQVHAYGAKLVSDALAMVNAIASGDYPLQGAVLITSGAVPAGPAIFNHDKASAVDAFESFVMGYPMYPEVLGRPLWMPGQGDGV